MAGHLGIVAKGRAALLAGEIYTEAPPIDGQTRWGLAMLLRPDPPMLTRLADLGAQGAAVAGVGHWAHGIDGLHVSLWPLERYHHKTKEVSGYVEALYEACEGLPAIRADVRTISPHPGGIAVHVHPHGSTLDRLDKRLGHALTARGLGVFGPWGRDIWYSNIAHFAGPVDVEALVEWADEHRDIELGVTTLSAVELVRYRFIGTGMRAATLHRQPLGV